MTVRRGVAGLCIALLATLGLGGLAVVQPAAAAPLATPAQRDSVFRLYRAYFLRDPEPTGHTYWAEQFATQQRSLTSIAQFFSQSPEFEERYGVLDEEAFVRLIYTNVLGRPADSKGAAYWVDALRRFPHRGIVMVGFSESLEFQRKTETLPPEVIPTSCATGCVPTFSSFLLKCRVPTYGANVRVAGGTDVTPYLAELRELTGVAFVTASLAEASAGGFVIEHLPGQGGDLFAGLIPAELAEQLGVEVVGNASVQSGSWGSGPERFVRATISLYEAVPSAATVRHELAHAFGLDHSDSPLMLAAGEDDDAGLSALEQAHLIGLGRRSGCRR